MTADVLAPRFCCVETKQKVVATRHYSQAQEGKHKNVMYRAALVGAYLSLQECRIGAASHRCTRWIRYSITEVAGSSSRPRGKIDDDRIGHGHQKRNAISYGVRCPMASGSPRPFNTPNCGRKVGVFHRSRRRWRRV